jgi:fused signal recognition particle receptor
MDPNAQNPVNAGVPGAMPTPPVVDPMQAPVVDPTMPTPPPAMPPEPVVPATPEPAPAMPEPQAPVAPVGGTGDVGTGMPPVAPPSAI